MIVIQKIINLIFVVRRNDSGTGEQEILMDCQRLCAAHRNGSVSILADGAFKGMEIKQPGHHQVPRGMSRTDVRKRPSGVPWGNGMPAVDRNEVRTLVVFHFFLAIASLKIISRKFSFAAAIDMEPSQPINPVIQPVGDSDRSVYPISEINGKYLRCIIFPFHLTDEIFALKIVNGNLSSIHLYFLHSHDAEGNNGRGVPGFSK